MVSKNKVLNLFHILSENSDPEWQFIDGSIIRAHQHSAGAAGPQEQAIGKSVGGNSTKIHMAVDSFGLPIGFTLSGGEISEYKVAPQFLETLPMSQYVIADKGYDYEALRIQIANTSAIPVIPRKINSKIGNTGLDWSLYKLRHLVENCFARIKHFRAIATRYDKLKRNYEAMLALACGYLWLPL